MVANFQLNNPLSIHSYKRWDAWLFYQTSILKEYSGELSRLMNVTKFIIMA